MGSTLRIIFVACFALFLLSGCSLFNNTIENCEEPQEYQESISIPSLVVPESLRNIQNKSVFNIANTQVSNAFSQESFIMPMTPDKSSIISEQNNQMANIDGDELSELLQLIDQTISNRQSEGQYEPIYVSLTNNIEPDSSLKPCLDGPPKYFNEQINPRSLPSQTFSQSSELPKTAEEEKSRRQKRIEARQKRKTGKQPQQDTSSKDSEGTTEVEEEDEAQSIWGAITGAVFAFFSGGTSEYIRIQGAPSVVPPKPTRPDEVDQIILEQVTTQEQRNAKVMAQKIRDLAVLDPALNDEQRLFIQSMSDKQILEMVGTITKQVKDQDTDEGAISDTEIIEEKEAKSRREARREARQQRRAKQQTQDD